MRNCTLIIPAVLFSIFATQARAAVIDVNFTAKGLGFTTNGTDSLNRGRTVDADLPGLTTSPVTGNGSILTILADGSAGVPAAGNPTMITLTANSRMDNFPADRDYQGGILFLSQQKDRACKHQDRNEGLGVRPYTVIAGSLANPLTGLRRIHPATGRAMIEGSKGISGGVDLKHGDEGGPIDPNHPNGAGHVDEIVYFDFNPSQVHVDADSFRMRFTKFKPRRDYLTLSITLMDGSFVTLTSISACDSLLFTDQGDNVWDLSFSGINAFLGSTVLDDSDVLAQLTVRAIERPNRRKSHFLINGISADVRAAPEPATLCVMGCGAIGLLCRRRSKIRRGGRA